MNSSSEVVDETQVTAVVVTYGARWNYLEALLALLEGEKQVKNVVVIDNASCSDIFLECARSGFAKPIVLRQGKNLGSAGGFRAGLEAACNLPNEFILLLDDDILPHHGAVVQLVNTYKNIRQGGSQNLLAVAAYRKSQHGNKSIPERSLFLHRHDCLGLNIFNFHQRYVFKIKGKVQTEPSPAIPAMKGCTAYAGLLFEKRILDVIGLPDDQFIMYFDDFEFTSRIIKAGGEIWLDVNSIFDDICDNYSIGVVMIPFLGYLMADSAVKVFYLIRNNMYLDRYVFLKNSIYYKINVMIFVLIIAIAAMFTFKYKRLTVILEGIIDGWNGKLGMNSKYNLFSESNNHNVC
jgi:Predicted glycosyltransferases